MLCRSLLVLALAFTASPPARAEEQADVRDLVERIGPAVVRLAIVLNGEDLGNGTGFFVREDGIVVTNHHVIADMSGKLVAVLRDGRRLPVDGVLADDEAHDLAIVRVGGRGFP